MTRLTEETLAKKVTDVTRPFVDVSALLLVNGCGHHVPERVATHIQRRVACVENTARVVKAEGNAIRSAVRTDYESMPAWLARFGPEHDRGTESQ